MMRLAFRYNAARMFTTHNRVMFTSDSRVVFTTSG
jgi:hypothetical protein